MKILAVGDPHGKLPKNLRGIIKKNKIEVIIITGEVSCVPMEVFAPRELKKFGERYSYKNFKEMVKKLCSFKIPVLVLRGNAYVGSKEGNVITKRIFSK
ncbi:MAG: metallophosphoesterase, partial [Nanoarchaeota archaeon]|nr:metallophosphoesterase [Nanoarchaeota archaeon]